MHKHLGRLLLAGSLWSAAASVAPAQPDRPSLDDDHPSHRLLNGGVGDLAGAEDQLARRLQHTHDMQEFQDIAQSLLKDLKPGDVENLATAIKNNPQLLDDPQLHEALQKAEQLKQSGALRDIPPKTLEKLEQAANDIIKQQKAPDPNPSDPLKGGPPGPTARPISPPSTTPAPGAPPQQPSQPGGWGRDFLKGVADLTKGLGGTPEGKALRTEMLKEISKLDSKSSGSSGLTGFLKGVLSSDQASWLTQRWKGPAGLGGWDSGALTSKLPSVGGPSGGMMDAVLWVAALALFVAAAWMAVSLARRRAGQARAAAWSPGPWPVRPSEVSTRQDLIRAFEHLAYLLLGPVARSLNHLDVAARLRKQEKDRAAAADRLARLYEQARYAPPDEALPADELTAARGDLAALAGAAA